MKRKNRGKMHPIIYTHTVFGEKYEECLARVLAE